MSCLKGWLSSDHILCKLFGIEEVYFCHFHNLKDEIHGSKKPKFKTAVAMATMIALIVNFGFWHFLLMAILNR